MMKKVFLWHSSHFFGPDSLWCRGLPGGVFHTMLTRHQTSAKRTAGEELTSSGPLKSPILANSDTDRLVVISEGRLTRSATRKESTPSFGTDSSPAYNPKVFFRISIANSSTKKPLPKMDGEFLVFLEGDDWNGHCSQKCSQK